VTSHFICAPWNDGVIIFHQRNCPAKVYSEVAGLEAVQSSGDAHLSQSRGAPWLPVTLI
jgi:hypothetical protein